MNPTARIGIGCEPIKAEGPLRLMNLVLFVVNTVRGLGRSTPAVQLSFS
jgi:hypothetical protein